MYFIFQPYLISASALPAETGDPEIASFHLNVACFFTKKTRNTVKNITWSELNHFSLSKRSTGCTRQELGREHSLLLSVSPTCFVLGKSVTVSVAVRVKGDTVACVDHAHFDDALFRHRHRHRHRHIPELILDVHSSSDFSCRPPPSMVLFTAKSTAATNIILVTHN